MCQTLPEADWLPIIVRCRDLDLPSLRGALDDILQHTLRKAELTATEAALALRGVADASPRLGRLCSCWTDSMKSLTLECGRAFCEQLEHIHVAYPQAPIVATSRTVGYREMGYRLRDFEHVTLADPIPRRRMTLPVAGVLSPNYLNGAPLPQMSSHTIFTAGDRIERLTGNPLLLTTMALVKRKVGKLPSRRADLCWEAVRVLPRWRRGGVDGPLDPYEAIPQLEYLAYTMCDRRIRQLRQDEIVDIVLP